MLYGCTTADLALLREVVRSSWIRYAVRRRNYRAAAHAAEGAASLAMALGEDALMCVLDDLSAILARLDERRAGQRTY